MRFLEEIVSPKRISSGVVTLAVVFFSCCSGNANQTSSTPADSAQTVPAVSYDNTLPTGRVADTIVCKNNAAVSYALYLPSGYTSSKKYPCIFFFDAHARGAMPVRSYKDLAEQYGFVLAGSNISKNGTPWNVTNEGAMAMIADVKSRINIDASRVYTSGFSGGSRVASSVAILDGGVAGVIGCAAGFPSLNEGPQSKFDYIGMVGDYDFNFTEMEQLDEMLEQNGYAHQLLTFSGIHGWPTAADFRDALLWIQVNAMREKLQPVNDTIVAALKNDLEKRITAANSSHELVKEQQLLAGMIRALDGLSDVSAVKKQLADLTSGLAYKDAVALKTGIAQEEASQQQKLAEQFTRFDDKWWEKKIAELNHNAQTAKTAAESNMYKRLVNYLGLVGYMNTNHALSSGDLTNAAIYLKIFKMADPKNPDCNYLGAIYEMKKGDSKQAIASLNEAANLGYSEVVTIVNDPNFASLQNEADFKAVLAKVQHNYSSK